MSYCMWGGQSCLQPPFRRLFGECVRGLEQIHIQPGDEVNTRNRQRLQTPVIRREKIDSGLCRARQVNRVGW